MRFFISSKIALLMVLCVSSIVLAGNYFLVEQPNSKVYKELDPKSPLIKQVQKGDYLDLIYDGTSWNKVVVDGQEGWIERRAGKIVEKQGGVPVALIIVLTLIALGVVGGVVYSNIKTRTPSVVEVDEV